MLLGASKAVRLVASLAALKVVLLVGRMAVQ